MMKKMLCTLLCAVMLVLAGVCALAEDDAFAKGLEAYNEGNYAAALGHWITAASNGDDNAMNRIGNLYYEGEGVEQDYAAARSWYEQAAQKENDAAIYNLGQLYYFGFGVEQDYAAARSWYEQAAALGNGSAMNKLGLLCGTGTEADHVQAVEWYQKAIDAGNITARYNLGVKYAKGEGVEKDYVKAAYWMEQALAGGETTVGAYEWLGYIYCSGKESMLIDYEKGVAYYEQAVELGSGYAMMRLGDLYRDGKHFEQSDEKALEYYNMALAAGEESAQAEIDALNASSNAVPAATVAPAATAAPTVVPTDAPNAAVNGVYTAKSLGMGGDVIVAITFENGVAVKVVVDTLMETAGIGMELGQEFAAAILAGNSPAVDVVSGATVTSNAVIEAATSCYEQAGVTF